LYDMEGKKSLGTDPLAFLEKRLPDNFLRAHRKYLINKMLIHQIKPHLKGRYVIEFKDKGNSSITSSQSYTEAIKSLIRL
ncbi:MAG: LytTR family DNA-binding domain-containing protein, partial [Bacteroidota bacterium]